MIKRLSAISMVLLQRSLLCYHAVAGKIGMLTRVWLVLPAGLRFLDMPVHNGPACNQMRFGALDARPGTVAGFSFSTVWA